MPHSEPLVGLTYFGFEGPRDAGENEPAMAPYTSNQRRRHLDQGSGQHVRDDERPDAVHNIGSAEHELQTVCQVVQARILGSDFQRIGIDIQATACGTPIISAVNASTLDPVPTSRRLSGTAMVKTSLRASTHSAVVG
jgi:hypothetical protein